MVVIDCNNSYFVSQSGKLKKRKAFFFLSPGFSNVNFLTLWCEFLQEIPMSFSQS